MSEEENAPPDGDPEGVPLIEGWMLGRLFHPLAMREVERVPPSNDDEG